MKKVKILFCDSLHFHERNFKSLFDFIESNNIEHSYMTPKKELLTAFGAYENFGQYIQRYKWNLQRLTQDKLYGFKYRNVEVFSCAKLELMGSLLALSSWRKESIPGNDEYALFKLVFRKNRDVLLANMAAVMYWVDFWEEELLQYRGYTYCCVFSGSNIYANALLRCLKTKTIDPLVFESFFTGNEYYVEKKYDALPNNSDLQYQNILNNYNLAEDSYGLIRQKIKYANKIKVMKNKNVKQPSKVDAYEINSFGSYILIAGQVLNDYSIINTGMSNINSIEVYKKSIRALLEKTHLNIVFKAHPWEEKKSNIGFPITYSEINNFRDSLPKKYASRVFVESSFNLQQLIEGSEGFLTLSSQAGLEAAFFGLKPIIIGKSFYSNQGFTNDFNDLEALINALDSNAISFKLSLQEFDAYEKFMIKALCLHLVCVHKSGITRLKEILNLPNNIDLVKKEHTSYLDYGESKSNSLIARIVSDAKQSMADMDIDKKKTLRQL